MTKSWVRHSLRAGVIAAGFLLFAGAPAQAADQYSVGNGGVLSGNNISVPVSVAANVCGVGAGIAGHGLGVADCDANAGNTVDIDGKRDHKGDYNGKHHKKEAATTEDDQLSLGNGGVLSGNNISVPVSVAANVCGIGVGALLGSGVGQAYCDANAGNTVDVESATTEDDQLSLGNGGVLSGNNISIPVNVAANICGIGLGVLGSGYGAADCDANAGNTVDIDGKGDKKHDKKGDHKGHKKDGHKKEADTDILSSIDELTNGMVDLTGGQVNVTALPTMA